MSKREPLPAIGWREWIALPSLSIPRIKVKVDTGARSSALHAVDVRPVMKNGRQHVRFNVHPEQRSASETIAAEAEVVDYRHVRSSGGQSTLRPVIQTLVEFQGAAWPIELTLVGRDEMGFRMLLGRQAVRDRFVVDPGRSFFGGRPLKKRLKKKKKKGTAQDRVAGRMHGRGSS